MVASVLAPYCFGRVRLALAVLVPSLAGWLWQEAAAGGLSWSEAAIALLGFGSGGAVAGYVATVSRQSEERRRLIEQLRTAQSGLAAVERQAGVLAERQRLARDIHDTLSQGFASVAMLLEAADATLNPGDPAARHVAAALRSARDNLAESRRVVWALRPELLGDGRLPEATRELLTRLEEETGVRTELVVTGAPHYLDQDAEAGLLRVIQEALANVRKHARATRVSVTVSYMDDVTVVDIQDDGAGFDVDVLARRNGSGGLGLRAMRERAAELGGRLAVESSPGDGTTIVVELPVRAEVNTPLPRGAGR
jgi:signal transduction histidine kinase